MRHTVVPSAERAGFRDRARAARRHYAGAGCSYWLFEEASLPGAYVEFFEGKDRETLVRAHRNAPDPVSDAARLYVEVELS
jgi:hypothetical protein